jgi:hypothetical protein
MPARPRKTTSSSAGRKTEALLSGVDIIFGGHTYAVPPYRGWSIDVLTAVDEQKYVRALEGILGADQWAEFRGRHATIGELEDFLSLVMEDSGQGNS